MNRVLIKYFISIFILIVVYGCATSKPADPSQKVQGFLPNYKLLKEVTSPEGTHVYVYRNTAIESKDYHFAMLESVEIYQTATESGVTTQQIASAKLEIESGIKRIVGKKFKITDKPGHGVFRVNMAITGATVEPDGFKPWNIIPVSAAIKLATMASGVDGKTPSLVVELKITDSISNKLIKETVSIVEGEKFRLSGNTNEAFDKLAADWINNSGESLFMY